MGFIDHERIDFVSGLFLKSGRVGGAEQMLYNMIDCLFEENFTVVLFVEQLSDLSQLKLDEYLKDERIKLVDFKCKLPRIIKEFLLPFRIPSSSRVIYPNYVSSPLSFFKRQKNFVFIHDLQYLHFPENFRLAKRIFQYFFHQISILFSYRVVAISSFVANDLVDRYFLFRINKKKIRVVWNCIIPRRYGSDCGFEACQSKPSPYVLVISSHYPHKNLPLIVESFKESILPSSGIKLVIVGQLSKNIKGSVRKIVLDDLIDDPMIEITGFLSDALLDSFLKNALALIHPSMFEGFGMPLVEAICEGRLVVASDIPPFRELVGDVPIYVEDYLCLTSWVQALNCLADPLFVAERQLLVFGRCGEIRDKFSTSSIGKKIGHLLR